MATDQTTPRLTFGEQINANIEHQDRSPDRQEVGETAGEMAKGFLKQLNLAIDTARKNGVKGRIYIQVREVPLQYGRNMVQQTFFVRRTRPTPDQCTYLYRHDECDDVAVFEYCLPEVAHLPFIFTHMSMFSKRYLDTICDWVEGKLK